MLCIGAHATTAASFSNSSGVLGHYLMDHEHSVGASGEIPGFEDRYYRGTRPNGIYIPRFQNLDDATRRPDFVRGYGFQGGASRVGPRPPPLRPGGASSVPRSHAPLRKPPMSEPKKG